jgi:hypothetical protein
MPDPLGNFEGGLMATGKLISGKTKNRKRICCSTLSFYGGRKNFVLSNLIEEVADNYYELLALDNQLDIIQQYIKLQQKLWKFQKFRKKLLLQLNWR